MNCEHKNSSTITINHFVITSCNVCDNIEIWDTALSRIKDFNPKKVKRKNSNGQLEKLIRLMKTPAYEKMNLRDIGVAIGCGENKPQLAKHYINKLNNMK